MRLTKTYIERYFALEAERKELSRRSSDLKKQIDELEAEMEAHVRETGESGRQLIACGHALAILTKAGTVEWKKEFIRAQGGDAAEALIQAAPTKEVFSITKL